MGSTATVCGTSRSPSPRTWASRSPSGTTPGTWPRSIRVYHHDEFLCRAVSAEIATVTVSMQDLQAARNQRRRELRQKLTARRSLVELLTQPPKSTAALTPTASEKRTTAGPGRPGTRLELYRED